MTTILGVFGKRPLQSAELERLLVMTRGRGIAVKQCWLDSTTCTGLAVGRYEWERALNAGEELVAQNDHYAIVADASIYYRRDLRQRLRSRGIDPRDDSASHLILAAYQAWGASGLRFLEGDFAFILWDKREHSVLGARDFAGTRPLFYGRAGESFVVASSPQAVVAHPDYRGGVDIRLLGETVAGLFNTDHESAYEGVSALAPGWRLLYSRSGKLDVRRHWEPPAIAATDRSSRAEAAVQLRSLLADAVIERLAPSGATGMWLSGGWDSSAVFATASTRLRSSNDSRVLAPISISYPTGDPGREDEAIESIASRYAVEVLWKPIGEIPLFSSDPARDAALRPGPFAHAFEMMNRALARGTRACGTHVAFSGTGGDVLFATSNVYLADLLRTGQWIGLAREWRRRPTRSFSEFRDVVLRRGLPNVVSRIWARCHGRDMPRGLFESTPPRWVRPDFIHAHGLLEREEALAPNHLYWSLASTEMHWLLTAPFFTGLHGVLGNFVLEEQVEHRMPLLDARLVEFAARRPSGERARAGETKTLLRAAMRGLLPDAFLAPRPRRTGVATQYLLTSMREFARDAITKAFAAPLLSDLGIIDAAVLRASWQRFLQSGNTLEALSLYSTFQAELWVRAQYGMAFVQDPLPTVRDEDSRNPPTHCGDPAAILLSERLSVYSNVGET